MKMEAILQEYGELLRKVDRWFAACTERHPSAISCRTGCSECCCALFDITLLDAWYLKHGFDRLDATTKATVLVQAQERLLSLQRIWPDFDAPYLLNYRPEEEWEILMPDDDETPCPLLGADGRCLVYDYRPMTCRLHGLPLVDISGEVLHDEWCTLNFTGSNPLGLKDLRWEFNVLFREEQLIFRDLTFKLFKHKVNELDTFIPTALLTDFERFPWRKWRGENPLLFPD
ncbi:MAG: YkgJ family cysteine cluster protein [Geobacteraceae bacterium]|jgi:Fe-S-cluster containining protein